MKFDFEAALRESTRSDLVSFDVFDTALLRKVERPVDIFRTMEFQASSVVGSGGPSFFQRRLAAEAAAKEHRTVTLGRIYEEFLSVPGTTASQREALGRLEMATEKKYTYAHPLILRLYRHALELKKTVIFLSDMYLTSECIGEILEFHGFPLPQVYVSAEWGGNKGSGKLYRIVQEHLQIPANRCLHFGDNFYADVLRARWNGWRAIHVAGANRHSGGERVLSASRTRDDLLSSSISTALSRKNATVRACQVSTGTVAEFWDGFGYEVVGPIYFHYLHWLCQQARRDNIKRLLFCARDGFPLLRGLEILKKAWDVPVEAIYFFASRRLINLSAIRELTPETKDFLLMPNPGLTLRDFVLRLNLDPAVYESALLKLGFVSLDERITHDYFGRFSKPAYRAWLGQWMKDIEGELLARLAKDRRLFENYLQEIEVDRPDTALVDIGWKASVAHAVQDLGRRKNPALRLRSYFFGTLAGAERLIHSGGMVQSFFTHLGKPAQRGRLISVHEGMVELLFAAPHGSIVGLEAGPNGTTSIHAKCEYTSEQLSGLERMQQGANRFVEEAALLLPDYLACVPSDTYVERCLSQLLLHPTREQAYHLGQMPYRVSYGESDMPRPFAVPSALPDRNFWSSQVQSYGRASWKRGFLAQVSRPQRWFLKVVFLFNGGRAALSSGTFWKSLKWALFRR